MSILIDTNVLLAYFYEQDINHERVKATMVKVRMNYRRAISVNADVRAGFSILNLDEIDRQRMEQIMLKYADAEFDYADAALMALSERLKITRVFTFDRRDFTMFIPAHAAHLDLLP